MSNPNNYPGADATIVGFVSADPKNPGYDKEGARGLKEIRVPVNHGYKDKDTQEFKQTGTTWFTYTSTDEILGGVVKGDKVRIEDAKMESREYTKQDGTNGVEFSLRFGTFTVLESNTPAPF